MKELSIRGGDGRGSVRMQSKADREVRSKTFKTSFKGADTGGTA